MDKTEFTDKLENGKLTIEVKGIFSVKLRHQLQETMGGYDKDKITKIFIDLEHVSLMDSEGLGALSDIRDQFEDRTDIVTIKIGENNFVGRLIRTYQLHQFFELI